MIEFFSPNSRALLPTSDGSHFAQMARGSSFAQKTTTSPCSLLSSHKPLARIHTYTKHPQPHQKTPLFPGLNLKVGKMNYHLGNFEPNWAKCLKVGKPFLEVGKKFIHLSQQPVTTPLPGTKDGAVGGSRQVRAHSETKCIQNQYYRYKPARTYVQQQSSSAAAAVGIRCSSRCSSSAAPAGQACPVESGGCRATQHNTNFGERSRKQTPHPGSCSSCPAPAPCTPPGGAKEGGRSSRCPPACARHLVARTKA